MSVLRRQKRRLKADAGGVHPWAHGPSAKRIGVADFHWVLLPRGRDRRGHAAHGMQGSEADLPGEEQLSET